MRPSAGLHGQSSSSSSRTDLQKLTIKVLKNRLSDLGVEESSFKYDNKQTLIDKVFQLENAMSKKVSKCPPKAKPKAVSKLREDKRLEFIKRQKENEEKLRKKKEEQEAERLRKNKEKEEKRLKVKVKKFIDF